MIKHRDGRTVETGNGQDRLLAALYGSVFGRMLLRPLVTPWVSKCAGYFMSRKISCVLIKPFIRSNRIDMSQYEDRAFLSYNDFFTRRIREGKRPVDMDKNHLISPADSKLTVLPVEANGQFTIKHTPYTVSSLLQNADLAKRYEGGWLLIFRLTVDDYHRYCYMADGSKEENVFIPGKLHTVNPIANDYFPIYKENAREYTVLHTEEFGDVLTMEVGALMVGKIKNHHGKATVCRGQEKGYFEFGGSTVVALIEKEKALIDKDILCHSCEGHETAVRMGEKIGQTTA